MGNVCAVLYVLGSVVQRVSGKLDWENVISADQIDEGCEAEQRHRELCIAIARQQAVKPREYYKSCVWCGDPSEGGAKFCSTGVDSCATDYNRYQQTLKRTGVAR